MGTPTEEGYISKATLGKIRVSPRKARLVVNMIKGRPVENALDILDCCDKKTAPLLKKLLLSAVANARERSGVNVDELLVKRAWVDEGPVLKRWLPRAHGRVTPLRKRSSSITVVLDEIGAS